MQDYDGAVNGLQVENRGAVTRIAAAVDASLATVRLAVAAKADLLLVHHGLVLGARASVDGQDATSCCGCLIENNLAVYSSHLPLDAHPRLGNNAQLCAALGLKKLRPFFFEPRPVHWLSGQDQHLARGPGEAFAARHRREAAA